jgi:UDP-GlcNAc:undecaprenyl-phosphate/decaprenyl-phosphate GlcNAc-1-phosphate transferase
MSAFSWMVLSFPLAIGLALFVTPFVMRSAVALKLYDSPDSALTANPTPNEIPSPISPRRRRTPGPMRRRMHELPVPRLGGIAVYLVAAAVGCLIFVMASHLFVTPGPAGDAQIRVLTGVFLGSALLFLVGLIDDLRGLPPSVKSGAQLIAAGVAWHFGSGISAIALGYGQGVSVGILEFPLFLLWVVGVTNAFNFIDGLNGLAGGIAVVASATIIIVGLTLGNFPVVVPAIALAGALLGFLPYNFPKGRIFLGDAGSMSVGFLLAVLSLQASVNRSGAILVAVPILALFVPLIDGALAIVRRWLRHVPLSGADARHIHHRLLALGVSQKRTAIILWALAAAMAGFGMLIALTAPFVAASIAILGLVGVAVLLIYGTNLLSYHEFTVAGEVLMSAPSRTRRIITDRIIALDLTLMIDEASSIEELASLLSAAANKFDFLAIELGGGALGGKTLLHNRLIAQTWAWKLEYPIRVGEKGIDTSYTLSIWCSQETSHRPYGAERIARVLGPALGHWFEDRSLDGAETEAPSAARKSPIFQRSARITR